MHRAERSLPHQHGHHSLWGWGVLIIHSFIYSFVYFLKMLIGYLACATSVLGFKGTKAGLQEVKGMALAPPHWGLSVALPPIRWVTGQFTSLPWSPCPACSWHLLNAGCCYQGPGSESGLTREITVLRWHQRSQDTRSDGFLCSHSLRFGGDYHPRLWDGDCEVCRMKGLTVSATQTS